MNDIAIKVQNLSKKYALGAVHTNLLSERLGTGLRSLYHKFRSPHSSPQSADLSPLTLHDPPGKDFWALRDVSFEVNQGEVLGIIGRNGAGKSTLLKILSRITSPTSGRVEIDGRVASLLEVGTGFHPELTGRENIFLNGAILGMTKSEIRRKFDEIVAFAEVEQFIDTPVKRYSSGMYVRLAFAVAAHLEPEVLIVDEVLAVGDAQFQKKCLGKMESVAKGGRTVLFVSHNMDAIRLLCQRVVWLDKGYVRRIGDTVTCVADYMFQEVREGGQALFEPPRRLANGMPVVLHSLEICDSTGEITSHFLTNSSIKINIEWENDKPLFNPRIGFVMMTSEGINVLTTFDANAWNVGWLSPGRRVSTCIIPGSILNEGEYVIDIGGDSPKGDKNQVFDFSQSRTGPILRFGVEDAMILNNKYYGQEGFYDLKWPGVILLDLPWEQKKCSAEEGQ